VRYLTEKQIKRDGYIWKFHKNDADGWPSPLHGLEYEKGLKLDVLTANIYDVGPDSAARPLKRPSSGSS
jgi:hypothetical protein